MKKKTYKSQSPEDTHRIAAEVLQTSPDLAVIALSGPLGAGKTVFVQGLALALGSDRPVTSPTFTLLNEYPGSRPLYHADLYRLDSAGEVYSLGIEECMEEDSAVIAIEWPERAPQIFPHRTVRVHLEMPENSEDERIITVEMN